MTAAKRRTVAVIQARMGSTRLPGKVLADIEGRTMLQRVIDRVRVSATVDDVVVATSTLPADDRLADAARGMGARVTRGSEQDVLDRYRFAAEESDASIVVRITADCPLIDPHVVDLVVRRFMEEPAPDLCSNVVRRTYPRGLDTEVLSADTLRRLAATARDAHHREHVTAYLYDHAGSMRLRSVEDAFDASEHRWVVDEPADLELVRQIYRRLASSSSWTWRDVLDLLAREPSLSSLNASVRQKPLKAES